MPWGVSGAGRAVTEPTALRRLIAGGVSGRNWAPYDTIVRDTAARHIGLDLALEAPAPLWATGPGVPAGTAASFLGSWEPSAKEFGLFVTAVGARYSGHYTPPGASSPLPAVHFWSIWNEPTDGQQLGPQAIDNSSVESSPATYRALLDAAWSALQATGHAGNTVLIGEIAPRGQTGPGLPGNFSGMVPLQFIRALYCVDGNLQPLTGNAAALRGCPTSTAASKAFRTDNPGLFDAAGFAFHPYPQGQVPPNVPTAPDGLGANYADLPQLPALERTPDGALAAYGSSYRFPLYDTEFGYQTNPPEKALRAISPAKAAYYENWAEYISWRDPRAGLLGSVPPGRSPSAEHVRHRHRVLGRCSQGAADQVFRMPIYMPVTAAKSGQDLHVWGCVRPAHYAMLGPHEPQFASIQFQSAPGESWKTVKRVLLTDAYGYFDTVASFPSSGNVRISWSYPHHGSEIHSRTVVITIG